MRRLALLSRHLLPRMASSPSTSAAAAAAGSPPAKKMMLSTLAASSASPPNPAAAAAAATCAPPICIDTMYQHEPQTAAAYLLIEGGKAAFVDNNTNHCLPILLDALKQNGLTEDDVDLIIITHIHLDHAGATGLLAKHCKNATILAHPRAAPHVVDPSRIVQGATSVYGPEKFAELYGEILPVDASRVKAMDDGQTVAFGTNGRQIRFVHTRGHAKHHMIVHDLGSNSVFTGDAFGVCYHQICRRNMLADAPTSYPEHGLFLFPSTSPVDFEPEEALAALDKIVATGADSFYLTHFDKWPTRVKQGVMQMRSGIAWHANLMDTVVHKLEEGHPNDEALYHWTHDKVSGWFRTEMMQRGLNVDALWDLHALDIQLNAQGLVAAAAFRHKQKQAAQPKPTAESGGAKA